MTQRYQKIEGPLLFVEALQIMELRGECADEPGRQKIVYSDNSPATIPLEMNGINPDVGDFVVSTIGGGEVVCIRKDDFLRNYAKT